MKKILYLLSSLLLAGWVLNAQAQDIWAYQIIGPGTQAPMTFKPPTDLTWPPAGAPAPVAISGPNRGVVMSAQEVAARRNAPHLIIMVIPAQIAQRSGYTIAP